MNQYIEYYFSSTSTANVSDRTNGVDSGRYYSLGNMFLCGDLISIESHYKSIRRSFQGSISDLLILIYSTSSVAVTNVRHSKRKSSFPMIAMHVDVIYELVWICRYAASISFFD